jgi:alpha-L-fucosidase
MVALSLTANMVMAFSVNAGEPLVQEKTLPDGHTELRVVSDAGKDLAVYKVDLKTRHEPSTERTGNIKEWENWRYGGFFCFNDNQFTGEECSKNRNAKLFNPSKLDISGWAKTMKNAGMKYAVLTTRHTSGFLLWDSPTSELDVGSSPGKPDVAGKFVKECRKAGIAPAFYYCLWGGKDWMPHPNARAIILAQLNELATKFGDIPYFWIDMVCWRPGNLSIQEIYDSIKNAQPNAIVIMNQAIQDGQTINYFPTDVMNGEVFVPPAGGHQPLRTVNGKQYYLPFEFEPVSQRRSEGTRTTLGAVGAWFTYGEGKGFEVSKPIETKVLFDWIKQAYDRGAANVLLSLAADHTGSMRSGDVRQLEELGRLLREAGLLETPKAGVFPARSLALGKPAKASGVWENNVSQYGAAMAFDGDPATRWGGPGNSRSGWLEVDLGNEVSVSTAVIQEGWDRTRKFSVQYKVGDEWKNAAEGTTIGAELELDFAPVKAQVFRLNITESTDAPTIWEFQLFGENSPRKRSKGRR